MSKKTREYAKELVSKMTVEEKTRQMLYESPAIDRLHIPAYNWWNESLHGVARAGVATVFPQAIALGATFDKNLIHEIADVISTEGRAKFNEFSKRGDHGIYKGLTFWAPNINIFRDPRWGRGHETFGEDPYLTSELGVSYIKGIQGEDSDHLKAAACAKHFAVHSGPESLRHEFDAKVSKRDLYDTYLYAFKRCVKEANVEAVMGAYNRVNGEPACGSKTLLTDILRNQWKFDGHVVSDCWAILDFHEHHHVTHSVEESAALAVKNGCDLNCGSAFLHLYRAYEMGLVKEDAITKAVERLMDVRIRLGMMKDYPSPYEAISYDEVESKEHIALAVEAARRSSVLLKNKNSILPLDKKKYKKIAVIGPNADSREALVGNYTGTSSEYITVVDGIRRYLDKDHQALYAEGAHLFKDKVENLAQKDDRITEAVIMAEQADVSVVCLGLDATIEGEQGDTGNAYASGDKLDLKFPGQQEELLRQVAGTGKPVILVVLAGSALDVSWAKKYVDGILYCWYPGARGGSAIADILFGEVSPNGKLPVTLYEDSDRLPDFCDYSMKGRTYRYTSENILYPFGYGLHYSKVKYSDAKIDQVKSSMDENVTLTATVENQGSYAVHESVQVYIQDEKASIPVPIRALKNVQIVDLAPQEKKKVEVVLKPRDFALISEDGKCVIEPGEFVISIGGSQPDEISQELTGEKVDSFTIEKYGELTEVEY